MKRIKQTKFGPTDGNCFAACIASLLEVPIEEVAIDIQGDNWWQSLQDCLKPKNLFFLEVRLDVAVKYPLYEMDGILCVFTGKSPRDFKEAESVNHAVVGMINSRPGDSVVFDYVHDPHPDNTFLKPESIWGLGFIMKLDPSKP